MLTSRWARSTRRRRRLDDFARHLDNYLKKWGAQGGPDRQILAHHRLGEMAWKASCPKASEDGACLEVKRVAATGRQKVLYDINKKRKKGQKIKEPKRTQCGPPTSSKITVFDRNKGPAVKGQEHFQTVLKIWKKGERASKITGKDVEARAGLAQYAVAASAFTLAETEYEGFLRIKFPDGLDFQQPSQYDNKKKAEAKKKKAEESVKRFTTYLDAKSKALGRRGTSTSRSSR